MEDLRGIKFFFNMVFSLLHLLIMFILTVFLINYNLIFSIFAGISVILLIVSYILILKKHNKGPLLLMIMGIINIPFGLLSLLSYFLLKRWIKEGKKPLKTTAEKIGGTIEKGEPTLKQHFIFPTIYLVILGILVLITINLSELHPEIYQTYIMGFVAFFILVLIGLISLYIKKYTIAYCVLGIIGILTIPLGLLLIYPAYKIYMQAERGGKK